MCINMNVGGTEKALLNMINEIPTSEYEVTILMLENCGGFISSIPDWVNIKYIDEFYKIKPILNKPPIQVAKDYLNKGNLISSLNIAFIHTISKLIGDRSLYFKYVIRNYPKLKEEYDIAVAYAGPMDFITYFILSKVIAKKKIQWIHFDITKVGLNLQFVSRFYRKFDKVFVVSEEARKNFIDKVPFLKDKTEVFYNIVSEKSILELSNCGERFQDNFEGVRILTVGRLSEEKGQDLSIKALYKLRQDGYKVRWYCIGEGAYRTECERLIKNYKLENDYILLGSSTNPYRYMKECDLYVQSSRYEGYCITLREARCFDNPIVTTNFTGASEQIKNKITGLICDISEDSIYTALKKLLDNKGLYKNIKYNLMREISNNNSNIKNREKIINL